MAKTTSSGTTCLLCGGIIHQNPAFNRCTCRTTKVPGSAVEAMDQLHEIIGSYYRSLEDMAEAIVQMSRMNVAEILVIEMFGKEFRIECLDEIQDVEFVALDEDDFVEGVYWPEEEDDG